MNKRSVVNEDHKYALVPQTNTILKHVLKIREESEAAGKISAADRRVSNWVMMLAHIAGHVKKHIEKVEHVRRQSLMISEFDSIQLKKNS